MAQVRLNLQMTIDNRGMPAELAAGLERVCASLSRVDADTLADEHLMRDLVDALQSLENCFRRAVARTAGRRR